MSSSIDPTQGIAYRAERRHANVRLFCISYAGGGASIYREWGELLPDWIEVCPLQLPGRETRAGEPLLTDLHEIVDELATAMEPLLDRPYALFGHSLGGLIAYELAAELSRYGHPPEALFVAGTPAPHLPLRRRPLHALPDAKLKEYLERLDGTPREVMNSPWLLGLYLPVLRADLQALETYVHGKQAPLPCPICAFGGTEDAHVLVDDLAEWELHTSDRCEVTMVDGHHFFVRGQAESVTSAIVEALAA